MLLTELIDLTLVVSGNFLFTLEDLNLTVKKFWVLTHAQLGVYQKYRPITKKINIDISDGVYLFTEDIPDWVSDVIPISTTNDLSAVFATIGSLNTQALGPRSVIWQYEKPNLYITESGLMDVTTQHKHSYVLTNDSNDQLVNVDLPDIDIKDDFLFVDLVRATFLQALGKSRTGFVFTEMPIEMDAAELVSEGVTLMEKTMEELEQLSKWYEAIKS